MVVVRLLAVLVSLADGVGPVAVVVRFVVVELGGLSGRVGVVVVVVRLLVAELV